MSAEAPWTGRFDTELGRHETLRPRPHRPAIRQAGIAARIDDMLTHAPGEPSPGVVVDWPQRAAQTAQDFKERCAAAALELTARYMRQPHYWMVVSRDVSRVEP